MNKVSFTIIPMLLLLFHLPCTNAQQAAQQEEEMTAEMFTELIKTEWTYLRDAVDQLINDIGKRGEFETTPEFQSRAARARQVFIEKISKHVKEIKLDRKTFGVWFKAELDSYNADTEIYSIKSSAIIESPYDLPTVECIIPENPYVVLSDSIKGGYRMSYIKLKFEPHFSWKVARSDAMNAKSNEHSIFFKVRFVLEEYFNDEATKAIIYIIPKEILLLHQQSKYVYWKDTIR